MDVTEYQKKVDEFREVGLEYRYKDQMMVQELGFTIVAIGVIVNGLLSVSISWGYICVQLVGGVFLIILARHLDHTNQDRRAALDRREALRQELGFGPTHLGVGGKRLSAPRTMVWFATWLIPLWALWCAVTLIKFFRS